MILGIGTDIVQVDRFKSWATFSQEKLLRVFSENELSCCVLQQDSTSYYKLECLASRFAAKEAFFKALSAALISLKLNQTTFSFLFVCQNVEVVQNEWKVPNLRVNWEVFEKKVGAELSGFQTNLSISHERNYAVAFVILSSG